MDKHVILVAEDDESDVAAIREAFVQLNLKYPLKIVGNGEEVISYLQGENQYTDRDAHPLPSMLILDLNMPRVTGWEVLAWLRQKPTLPPLFVVVMTSCGQTEQTHETFEFHGNVCIFSCYLLKPIAMENVDMLIHFFESWLQSRL